MFSETLNVTPSKTTFSTSDNSHNFRMAIWLRDCKRTHSRLIKTNEFNRIKSVHHNVSLVHRTRETNIVQREKKVSEKMYFPKMDHALCVHPQRRQQHSLYACDTFNTWCNDFGQCRRDKEKPHTFSVSSQRGQKWSILWCSNTCIHFAFAVLINFQNSGFFYRWKTTRIMVRYTWMTYYCIRMILDFSMLYFFFVALFTIEKCVWLITRICLFGGIRSCSCAKV